MKKTSPNRDYKDYLLDIDYSLKQAEKFVVGFDLDSFSGDNKTIYAVVRALEIVGEATKNIPQKFKKEHVEIPWKKLADMRNILIHEYFGVNKKVVWKIIKQDIPEVKNKMSELIKELDIDKKVNKLILF
jgi:uncharacterized protein with HEPN domain